MTACRSQAKSTSNPTIIATINTARSHVTILSTAVGERKWLKINCKNLDVKVMLAFLMAPLPSRHPLHQQKSARPSNSWWSLSAMAHATIGHLLQFATDSRTRRLKGSYWHQHPHRIDIGGWRAGRYRPECHVLKHAQVGPVWRGQPAYLSVI